MRQLKAVLATVNNAANLLRSGRIPPALSYFKRSAKNDPTITERKLSSASPTL